MKSFLVLAAILLLSLTGVKAAVGDAGEHCKEDGTCTGDTLFCETQSDNSKKCKVKGGQSCASSDTNCIANATCDSDDQTCVCDTDYVINPDNTTCLAKVGITCSDAVDCVANTDCSVSGDSKMCTCKSAFTAKDDNTECLANVGTDCSAANCVENAQCPSTGDKVCQCPNTHLPEKDKTKCSLKVNETCDAGNNQCGTNAECSSSKRCNCTAGNAADPMGGCGKKSGDTCTANKDCVSDATCSGSTDKKCACADGYEANDNKFCEKKSSGVAASVAGSILLVAAAFLTSHLL